MSDDLRKRVMDAITDVWDHSAQIDHATDDVMEMILADRAARAETWRPIATAPKDGTRVLIWGPNSDTVVCYCNEWAHEPKWQPAAVEASGAQGYPDVTIRGEPTHWMPLPDTPTQKIGAENE